MEQYGPGSRRERSSTVIPERAPLFTITTSKFSVSKIPLIQKGLFFLEIVFIFCQLLPSYDGSLFTIIQNQVKMDFMIWSQRLVFDPGKSLS